MAYYRSSRRSYYNSSYRKKSQPQDNKIYTDKRFGPYKVVGRGTNAQDRSWVRRQYLSGEYKGKIGFDYHGKDGSYSYNHPDGSQYFNDGKGVAKKRGGGKEAWVDCSKGQESGGVKTEPKERKERKETRRTKEGSGVVVKKEAGGVAVKKEEAD